MREPNWLESRRAAVAGQPRRPSAARLRHNRAQILEGLSRVRGIDVIGADELNRVIWIAPRDRTRADLVGQAIEAENLPVQSGPLGSLGLPLEDWFNANDLRTIVLSVTKVAYHLALT